MISRSASRRIRRERTGGQAEFHRRQQRRRISRKAETVQAELRRVNTLLSQNIKMERDPATNRFVSLKGTRHDLLVQADRFWKKLFGSRSLSDATTA